MRILYLSVHQVLEYDEIRMFQDLGHFAFPLGVYFGGSPVEPFRPPLHFSSPFEDMLAEFQRLGGVYRYAAPADQQVIPRSFVEQFDVVIVMHDLDFIERHWSALSAAKVVWRSIGVGTEQLEPRVAALRSAGMLVVRYCSTEQIASRYAGHDAVIRFGKVEDDIPVWQGGEAQVLTFSHLFRQRFPVEYAFYVEAVAGVTSKLGGTGNEDVPGALGIVDFATQQSLLTTSSLYFYGAGTFIPYTLNFMEAWLSGIPLVALDCRAVYSEPQCRFAEVPTLITSGVDGYLVRSPEEARRIFRDLMADEGLARRIGAAGAERARAHFSSRVIGPQWQAFFADAGLPA